MLRLVEQVEDLFPQKFFVGHTTLHVSVACAPRCPLDVIKVPNSLMIWALTYS